VVANTPVAMGIPDPEVKIVKHNICSFILKGPGFNGNMIFVLGILISLLGIIAAISFPRE
jgi:hypothetical protein